MSYRTLKRLLGETSLERKCRLLFGGGLLLLISSSFYFYSKQTQKIISEHNLEVAKNLVPTAIIAKHADSFDLKSGDRQTVDHQSVEQQNKAAMVRDLKPEKQKEQSWALLKESPKDSATSVDDAAASVKNPAMRPIDEIDHEAIRLLSPKNPGAPLYWQTEVTEVNEDLVKCRYYVYYARVEASKSCLACHIEHNQNPHLKEKDVLGIVKIK